MITAVEAVRSLHSATCFCLRQKDKGKSFCLSCFRVLPPHMQRALYNKVGEGYEAAYEQAKRGIAQMRTSAVLSAPGTDRSKIERRRRHETISREQAFKREK